MGRWSRGASVLGALLAPVAVPAAAPAGTYMVRACDTSTGHFPNRSWSYGVDQYFNGYGACANAGEAIATEIWPGTASIPPGTARAMTFTAPPGATISDFRLRRTVYVYSPRLPAAPRSPYVLFSLGSTAFAGAGDAPQREAVHAAAPSHWYGYPADPVDTGDAWLSLRDFPALHGYGGDANTLSVALGCAPGGSACSLRGDGWVTARLFGAEVSVSDSTAPQLGEVRLAPAGATLTASDNSGIASVEILDVRAPGAAVVLAREDYHAAPTDGNARCDFAQASPCPQLREETIGADLPPGRDGVAVRVVDAAGNEAVSSPGTVESQLAPPENGAGASAFARVRAWLPGRSRRTKARTVAFGGRTPIAGALADEHGRPIAGASLDVLAKPGRLGARWRLAGRVATDDRGRFRTELAAGPSRRVRVAYRAYSLDPAYTAVADVTLRVRAGVRFVASPRRVRNGSWITFRGRLLGGPARDGVTVVVYAVGPRLRGGRSKVPVEALRTDRRGRFAYRYRFSNIAGPFHYRFQARVRADRGYPYAPGRSRIVHVRARP